MTEAVWIVAICGLVGMVLFAAAAWATLAVGAMADDHQERVMAEARRRADGDDWQVGA